MNAWKAWLSAAACAALAAACSGSQGGSNGPPSITVPVTDCTPPVQPVDTSSPDSVVGDGTAGSCTESAVDTAVNGGGVITFNCGPNPVTITLTQPIHINNVAGTNGLGDTVIDGGGMVTLSGGGSTRILELDACSPPYNSDHCQDFGHPSLTVQNLTFEDGKSSGTGGDTTVGGGAIYRRGGRLVVIDSNFINNQAPLTGQDVAGGAIYATLQTDTIITGSTFMGNQASNGGAIGVLHSNLTVVNTVIEGNAATGAGGNPGNGGNGGGIYSDGIDQDESLCGVQIENNTGNAYGGGVFRVSNDQVGTMTIDRTTVSGNSISLADPSKAGGMYLQGFDLTITNSTISGNEASGDGGMFLHQLSSLKMANVTVADNTCHGLGGGITIGDVGGGLLLNCTFANNHALGTGSFAAAINGDAGNLAKVTLQNSIIADNDAGNAYNPLSCLHPLADGGGNIQWPDVRSTSSGTVPDDPCASGVTFADPGLGPLQDNGGPTFTILPSATGPAAAAGMGCPPIDQRGNPRTDPCTSGAVELP